MQRTQRPVRQELEPRQRLGDSLVFLDLLGTRAVASVCTETREVFSNERHSHFYPDTRQYRAESNATFPYFSGAVKLGNMKEGLKSQED